ncbi:MAG: hypothetical protein R3E83_11275, partial [Burkholderiaceae bacterium]
MAQPLQNRSDHGHAPDAPRMRATRFRAGQLVTATGLRATASANLPHRRKTPAPAVFVSISRYQEFS